MNFIDLVSKKISYQNYPLTDDFTVKKIAKKINMKK